jgi:hypothetical protein
MAWANANPHFMTVRIVAPNEQLAQNMTLANNRENSRRDVGKGAATFAGSGLAIPRTMKTGLVDTPNLLADNGNRGGLQLSPRF